MPQRWKYLTAVTYWTIIFLLENNVLIGKAKGPPEQSAMNLGMQRILSLCLYQKSFFVRAMESPVCDFADWDDEDLQGLDECDKQKILDGNPVFQYFASFSVFQYSSASPVSQYSSLPLIQYSLVPPFQLSSIGAFHLSFSDPVFQFSIIQYSSIPVLQYSSISVFQSSSIRVFQYAVSNSFRLDLAKYKSVGNKQIPLAFS